MPVAPAGTDPASTPTVADVEVGSPAPDFEEQVTAYVNGRFLTDLFALGEGASLEVPRELSNAPANAERGLFRPEEVSAFIAALRQVHPALGPYVATRPWGLDQHIVIQRPPSDRLLSAVRTTLEAGDATPAAPELAPPSASRGRPGAASEAEETPISFHALSQTLAFRGIGNEDRMTLYEMSVAGLLVAGDPKTITANDLRTFIATHLDPDTPAFRELAENQLDEVELFGLLRQQVYVICDVDALNPGQLRHLITTRSPSHRDEIAEASADELRLMIEDPSFGIFDANTLSFEDLRSLIVPMLHPGRLADTAAFGQLSAPEQNAISVLTLEGHNLFADPTSLSVDQLREFIASRSIQVMTRDGAIAQALDDATLPAIGAFHELIPQEQLALVGLLAHGDEPDFDPDTTTVEGLRTYIARRAPEVLASLEIEVEGLTDETTDALDWNHLDLRMSFSIQTLEPDDFFGLPIGTVLFAHNGNQAVVGQDPISGSQGNGDLSWGTIIPGTGLNHSAVFLITQEQFDRLPDDTRLTTINGEPFVVGRDEVNDEGMSRLPVGFAARARPTSAWRPLPV